MWMEWLKLKNEIIESFKLCSCAILYLWLQGTIGIIIFAFLVLGREKENNISKLLYYWFNMVWKALFNT